VRKIRPAVLRVKPFCGRLGDVMQYSRPSQPQVVRKRADIVHHLEGMVEIVLVRVPVHDVHTAELHKVGKDDLKKPYIMEKLEAPGWLLRKKYLVQFLRDPLLRDNANATAVPCDGRPCVLLDEKVKLGGEAYRPHHPQRIVAEGHVRISRCADDAVLQILATIEGIAKLPVVFLIERNAHGVDREVAPDLIILQCALLHDRLSGR
jgi:hypothetical protein